VFHFYLKNFFLNCIVGGGIKVHSTLRLLNDLLCQPRVIMIIEKSVEWLAGETEVLGENLPQCRFVHHKPHMLPVREPGPPRWEASVYPLSYGTAYYFYLTFPFLYFFSSLILFLILFYYILFCSPRSGDRSPDWCFSRYSSVYPYKCRDNT
jgi:hypothetical protein